MRGAPWLVLLLLAPLSSGMLSPLNLLPDTEASQATELILTRDAGVWTSDDWNAFLDRGIQPLRTLSPEKILVWSNEEIVMQQGWSVEPAKHAALRVPEGWEGGSEAYRFLLEPRLPAHAIRDIILSLDGFGLTLNHAALDVRGNLPASLTVETTLPTLPVQTLYIPGLLWLSLIHI